MAIGTGAALLGSALIGAASSAISGKKTASASKTAAKQQQDAIDRAIALQEKSQAEGRALMEPYIKAGGDANALMASLMNPGVPRQQPQPGPAQPPPQTGWPGARGAQPPQQGGQPGRPPMRMGEMGGGGVRTQMDPAMSGGGYMPPAGGNAMMRRPGPRPMAQPEPDVPSSQAPVPLQQYQPYQQQGRNQGRMAGMYRGA